LRLDINVFQYPDKRTQTNWTKLGAKTSTGFRWILGS